MYMLKAISYLEKAHEKGTAFDNTVLIQVLETRIMINAGVNGGVV